MEVVQFLEYILKVELPNSAGGLDVGVREISQGCLLIFWCDKM